MSDFFQVLSDCPNCLVQSAMMEVVDPADGEGVVVEGQCRLCHRRTVASTVVSPGQRFATLEQARDALDRWAESENEPDAEAFCTANLGGMDLDQAAAALVDGRTIETSFDVIAYLFPGMGGLGAMAEEGAESAPAPVRRPTPAAALLPTITLEQDAKAAVAARALAAVMVADGEVRPGEMRFLEGFLQRAGLESLEPGDVRPWRPQDLATPDDPWPILEAMIQLALVDKERDGSEWRVVREFGRYWRVDLKELEVKERRAHKRAAPAMQRLWWALRSLFVTEKR